MSRIEVEQAYERFLASSDTATWAGCLRAYARKLDGASGGDGVPSEWLNTGYCISVFLSWLGSLSGDKDAVAEARQSLDRFEEAIRARHLKSPSADTRVGLGLLLAAAGYRKAGGHHMGDGEMARPEIAMLFEPGDPARGTAFLLPFVLPASGRAFPPAVFRYCYALLRLGAVENVKQLTDKNLLSGGMLAEIEGRWREQSGEWSEARDIYERHAWPGHEYRKTICESILRGMAGVEPGRAYADSVATSSQMGEMSVFETEIDQAEVARSAAFINACQWNGAQDWLIQFELGKLSFRRRRYCEAEANLSKAYAIAPPGRRAPILRLRFSNLTWLNDTPVGDISLCRDLPFMPETLVCARMALACGADEAERTTEEELALIRIWLAGSGGEPEAAEPVLRLKDPGVRGMAHYVMGNLPEAIDCMLLTVQSSYDHRAIQKLIRICHACGLERAAACLVDVVMEESWDDFFVLWELGSTMLESFGSLTESPDESGRARQRFQKLAIRIEELSQSDFQNLLRAYELFRKAGSQEVAESMLNRAAALADGAEENLAIAVARRLVPRVRKEEADPQALACLLRAERESRDRLERLQIARELFLAGQTQRARRILTEDGIVGPGAGKARPLTPIEAVVALSCAPRLRKEELRLLAEESIKVLLEAVSSGTLGKEARRFVRRLHTALYIADQVLAAQLEDQISSIRDRIDQMEKEEGRAKPQAAAPGEGNNEVLPDWTRWVKSLAATGAAGIDGERGLISTSAGAAASSGAGFRIALWRHVIETIQAAVEAAEEARPTTEPRRTPFIKSKGVLDLRAQEVCDLWKSVLQADDDPNAPESRRKLVEFYTEERRLLDEWEALRQEKAQWARSQAVLYAAAAPAVLDSLIEVPRPATASILDGFYHALVEDARALKERAPMLAMTQGERKPELPFRPPERQAARTPRRAPRGSLLDRYLGMIQGTELSRSDFIDDEHSPEETELPEPGAPSGTDVVLSELFLDLPASAEAETVCVMCARFPGGNGEAAGRTLCCFAAPELAVRSVRGDSDSVYLTDLPAGRLPRLGSELELALAVFVVPRSARSQRILQDVRRAAAALDYERDLEGSLQLAKSIFDRLDVLRMSGELSRVIATGLSERTSWEAACSESLLVLPSETAPRERIRMLSVEGRLQARTGAPAASPWRGGSFVLVRLGRRGGAASGLRALERLRQAQNVASAGRAEEADGAEPRESYRDRDLRLRRTRDLAARFGRRAFDPLPAVEPLTVTLGAQLAGEWLTEGRTDPKLAEKFSMMRDGLFYELGFPIPAVAMHPAKAAWPPTKYTIGINGTVVVSGSVELDRVLVNALVPALGLINIEAELAVNPANGNECAWISKNDEQAAEAAQYTTWDAQGYMVLHLSAVIRKNCAELVTVQRVAAMIREWANVLYRRMTAVPGGIARFTGILRGLLSEEASIRVFRPICEQYLELHQAGRSPVEIVEELRFGDAIRHHLRTNKPGVPLYELGTSFVRAMETGVFEHGHGQVLALKPELCQEMLKVVRTEVSKLEKEAKNPVVIVDDWRLRPFVRRLTELEFPHLAIVARRELIEPAASRTIGVLEI